MLTASEYLIRHTGWQGAWAQMPRLSGHHDTVEEGQSARGTYGRSGRIF